MKTLEELKAIREKMQSQVSMRAEDHTRTRILVGMATCGIASGARPVLNTLSDLVQENHMTDRFSVTPTGCIGLCQYEPIVEVLVPGKEKVTYINMTPEKAEEVYREHLLAGHVLQNYTLASADIK
ncbi:(2Fe-2S) ferredoxin domain-containing protein [Lachnospiraceae bacterium 54-53]